MAKRKETPPSRKQVTRWLGDLLMRDVFHVPGDPRFYWASEVTLDNRLYTPGAPPEIRVDFIQFKPVNKSPGGIDAGQFCFFEVKSCIEDFKSDHGHNLFGDRNYYVMTNELFNALVEEDPHLSMLSPTKRYGSRAGVYVPVNTESAPVTDAEWNDYYRVNAPEMCLPNPFRGGARDAARLKCVYKGDRNLQRPYSTSELLFAMMRSAGRDRVCCQQEYWNGGIA